MFAWHFWKVSNKFLYFWFTLLFQSPTVVETLLEVVLFCLNWHVSYTFLFYTFWYISVPCMFYTSLPFACFIHLLYARFIYSCLCMFYSALFYACSIHLCFLHVLYSSVQCMFTYIAVLCMVYTSLFCSYSVHSLLKFFTCSIATWYASYGIILQSLNKLI